MLDGTPVTSCLLPAHTLEGRSVQTIEHFGPELHPIQRTFVACDALQCGFCTPGFVIAGIAFYKKGGNDCPARTGHHQHGVVFDLGPCVFSHPATLGMALLTYAAEVESHGQGRRPITALFGVGSDPSRNYMLNEGELLTRSLLPPPVSGEQAAYFRAISRAAAEWPLVEAAVHLVADAGTIRFARVGVGGVANIPLRFPAVEATLVDQPATAETFARRRHRNRWRRAAAAERLQGGVAGPHRAGNHRARGTRIDRRVDEWMSRGAEEQRRRRSRVSSRPRFIPTPACVQGWTERLGE
ncbi:MAG: 2Fe-2S iron-sulfur cluster-binding protein [Chloroflexales bacterium]|nr:2Fe-2S iron-sulfur cluster-binding protein [Chloroflexales bacterium]